MIGCQVRNSVEGPRFSRSYCPLGNGPLIAVLLPLAVEGGTTATHEAASLGGLLKNGLQPAPSGSCASRADQQHQGRMQTAAAQQEAGLQYFLFRARLTRT
jgi:hypothetical protein